MDYLVTGLSVSVLVTVVFALHGVVQQQMKNLQERLEAEAIRLKDNTDKAERRLDDLNRLAELRVKEETTKAEERFDAALTGLERRCIERLVAMEDKLNIKFTKTGG